ncbi:MAG: uroporphyrinogen-III C-methyltransferase [Campylobacterales bacterium]|nr:uroporphyrinogen-III C-methyltransferase [Campylobacterales bacterium]
MIYLTGAGPGDVELLTVKALKAIEKADVIIYDRLANPKILDKGKEGVKLIYVGKEDGRHTLPQSEINQVIYDSSKKYENVVRLKGGDPFVFGRGGEEAIFLKEKGMEFEIIPGITSAISVPASFGIPVTHRGVSPSFRVVTGHEDPTKKESLVDWESFKTDETIVFLMGFHKLEKIVKKLIEVGKSKDYPCCVISKGTTKEGKCVVGDLSNIVSKSKGLETPALIVVGKVVDLNSLIF